MSFEEKEPPKQPGDGLIEYAAQNRQLICRGLSCLTTPFVRFGGGREVEGRVVALVMLAGWTFFTHDIFCLLYSGAWIVAMVAYAATMRRSSHSQWEGNSYLQWLGLGYRTANVLEVFVVAGIGYAVHLVAPLLGMLILASAGGKWCNLITDWWEVRKEVIAYQDSAIVMRNRREAYKRGR